MRRCVGVFGAGVFRIGGIEPNAELGGPRGRGSGHRCHSIVSLVVAGLGLAGRVGIACIALVDVTR